MVSPKISIIIPVYNAKKTICKCLDSILNQSFVDWEAILVDDGSSDNSGAICDDYAAKDSRFLVIHKQNGGVSSARQAGLDAVKGEYVIHADPDDWIELPMLEELYAKAIADDADMVICDFYIDKSDSTTVREQNITSLKSSDLLNELFIGSFHGSCCNKLIKRSCIIDVQARFPAGINYCEDVCFLVQILKYNIKIEYLHKAYYHYVQYNSSITNGYTVETLNVQKQYVRYLSSLFPEESLPVVTTKTFVKRLAFNNKILKKKDFDKLYPEIKQTGDNNRLLKFMYKCAFSGHYTLARIMLYLYDLLKH